MSRHRHPLMGDRLRDAILSLQPTAYWPLDDSSGPLRDLIGRYTATVTGSPTYGVAAPSPIGRGVTWSGTGQYAESSTSVPVPTTSMSALVIYRAPSTSGKYPFARTDAAHSWATQVTGATSSAFSVYQTGGALHAAASSTGVVNDNAAINVLLGTFDGTTIRARGQTDPAGQSSTTLTGSWQKGASKVTIAAFGFGAGLLAGTTYAAVYWADRVITESEYRYLVNVALGG